MPFALERSTLAKCGPMFTKYGCFVRSLRSDSTGSSTQLLYLSDGTMMVRVWADRRPYFLPLVAVMRACSAAVTDKEIFSRIVADEPEDDTYTRERLTLLLAQGRTAKLVDHEACLAFLGAETRRFFRWLPHTFTASQVGQYFIDKFILVHLRTGHDKVLLLCHMARKLLALVRGRILSDNLDVLGAQELWTPGMLYGAVVKVGTSCVAVLLVADAPLLQGALVPVPSWPGRPVVTHAPQRRCGGFRKDCGCVQDGLCAHQ